MNVSVSGIVVGDAGHGPGATILCGSERQFLGTGGVQVVETAMDANFIVTTEPVVSARRPVIGVDGPVRGADLCFDHHATGEPVNLLAIPAEVPCPGTLATTLLDSDAIISAAVVLLRAAGEGAAVRTVWPVLYEAAHYCDWLGPSGQHPDAEMAGVGLHCWLKDRGFALGEILAWERDEMKGEATAIRPAPSPETRGIVFGRMTRALITAVRRGALPNDLAYLDRLRAMDAPARQAIKQNVGRVTVLEPDGYVDPLAYYRVVDTDLVVVVSTGADGRHHYSLGVHPRAYRRVNLRPILAGLARREPGWGGRENAGGSPFEGSRLSLDEVLEVLNS